MPRTTPTPSTTAKLASYLTRLSPVPTFPDYTGPYKVGTVDVEVPMDELESPAPVPDGADKITTVLFRVFYPAVSDSNEKPIGWLPTPQRQHVSAYTKFLGIGSVMADFLSSVNP